MRLDFWMGLRTKSGNHGHGREHWAARAKRVERERKATALAFLSNRYGALGANAKFTPPIQVHLTRVKPGGRPLDDDNLSASLKAVRDELAKQLGVDDGDKTKVKFSYGEDIGAWGVGVSIRDAQPDVRVDAAMSALLDGGE